MIKRQIANYLIRIAKQFKVITITGPRQSGKTTLCKLIFPSYQYYSLENPDIRLRAKSDPRAFLKDVANGIILDEVQNVPDLLSYIQEIADNLDNNGKIILTGSNQFEMMDNVSQTLAGRTAIIKLLPCSISEIMAFDKTLLADELLIKGFYPGIHYHKQEQNIAYRSYYETYIERDLRKLIAIKDIDLFQKFVKLCAGRIGQLFNANSLANEVGVTSHTIQSWLTVLKKSFIVFTLVPFYENISKRLVKMPKLYFYDTGLASYLLGIENTIQMERDPLRGQLFENMVIVDFLKQRYNKGLDDNIFFYRDSNGNEVDLLIKAGHQYTALEIKASLTYNSEFQKGLKYIKKILGESISESYVIYGGDEMFEIEKTKVIPYKSIIIH